MKVLLDLKVHAEFLQRLIPYYEHWEEILEEALRRWRERGGATVKMFVFGSVLEGKAIPPSSDIDVLIVLQQGDLPNIRRRWLSFFRELHPLHPFEFHFANQEIFHEWYLPILKGKYREIET